ncbi:hypothetical protein BZG36_00162 [Bifiguratus adelaidae]|uniref:C2H2-type domain-containing protein n=1 Tax=Bifiguratus adelaidae TaxID=1938954 RepID=A0A261Y893_9FUNG|nr:hypothetical protein BZG36_00162 [Bifiguratus adelaidae]
MTSPPPDLDEKRNTSSAEDNAQSSKSTSSKKGKGGARWRSGGKPKLFQCTGFGDCRMIFTRSEHLARHARKHTGEKPFKCIVAGCGRMFSRFDNMMQHTQTHSHGARGTKAKSAAKKTGQPKARTTAKRKWYRREWEYSDDEDSIHSSVELEGDELELSEDEDDEILRSKLERRDSGDRFKKSSQEDIDDDGQSQRSLSNSSSANNSVKSTPEPSRRYLSRPTLNAYPRRNSHPPSFEYLPRAPYTPISPSYPPLLKLQHSWPNSLSNNGPLPTIPMSPHSPPKAGYKHIYESKPAQHVPLSSLLHRPVSSYFLQQSISCTRVTQQRPGIDQSPALGMMWPLNWFSTPAHGPNVIPQSPNSLEDERSTPPLTSSPPARPGRRLSVHDLCNPIESLQDAFLPSPKMAHASLPGYRALLPKIRFGAQDFKEEDDCIDLTADEMDALVGFSKLYSCTTQKVEPL